MGRPLVLVIEDPDYDPEVLTVGEVEVVQATGYYDTHFASELDDEDRLDYANWLESESCRLVDFYGWNSVSGRLVEMANDVRTRLISDIGGRDDC